MKIPNSQHFSQSNKSIWLSVLYFYKNREVDKNEISLITRHYNPKAQPDQQVRHLKRDGWNIGNKSGVHKLDPYIASAEYLQELGVRRAVLGARDFEDIKKAFDYRCASCGAKEGETSQRYGTAAIQLQKGHRDPAGDGDDPQNIIPQCQYCNRAYLDDWVFDEKGRTHSIASIRPVKRSRNSVQLKVLEYLNKKFPLMKMFIFKL